MAYDLGLAERVRDQLAQRAELVEKKMFGGVGFMLNGNMACGIYKDKLMLRVGVDAQDAFLAQDHVQKFDVTGKPMNGWLLIEPEGLDEDDTLGKWVDAGLMFTKSLPPK